MLKIENIDTYGWEAAIRGCRNPRCRYNICFQAESGKD